MSGVVRRSLPARRDLVQIYPHLARNRSPASARRFLARAEESFRRLASMPGIGTRYGPIDPSFADLRVAPVSRFKPYLIFYFPSTDGIMVLRVLHGARDIDAILNETLRPDDENRADDDNG